MNSPLRYVRGVFNNDGFLDAADYVVWRKGLGTPWSLATYDTWRAHVGEAVTGGTALTIDGSQVGVPEPALLGLVAIAALPHWVTGRRSRIPEDLRCRCDRRPVVGKQIR